MQEVKSNYRGHLIIPTASGPNLSAGPFISSYAVWLIEENNSFKAVIQGSLSQEFSTQKDAYEAATIEAKEKLDKVLS